MAKNTGLGKGIEALITSTGFGNNQGVLEVNINDIEPTDNQPRKDFDQEKIEQLAISIKEHGIIQPLIVKKEGNVFKIIAGERRWRAARVAGLKKVPVIERDATTREIMEIALIENIQREDLNPIEEAVAFDKLMKEYDLTQEKLSEIVGKSRSAIANSLRLLSLGSSIKNYVIQGLISAGHARTLITLENAEDQLLISDKIINNNLNVRETEKLVKDFTSDKEHKIRSVQKGINPDIARMQDRLKSALQTKVILSENNGKGKILIEFFNIEERERLLEYLLKR